MNTAISSVAVVSLNRFIFFFPSVTRFRPSALPMTLEKMGSGRQNFQDGLRGVGRATAPDTARAPARTLAEQKKPHL